MAEDKLKEAAAHYRQGKSYEDAGAYDQAIVEYKAAYALDKKASHLFNIARAYDTQGDLRAAVDYYDKFLAIEDVGATAKAARDFKARAMKQIAAEDERKQADADATRKAEELKQRSLASQNHLKQAAEFARNNQWASAAAEYERAEGVDGDPEHLFDAAEAYRKIPDFARARALYERYRDKVQVGGRSDDARRQLAAMADEIARAKQAEENRRREEIDQAEARAERAERSGKRGPGYILMGIGTGALAVGGVFALLGDSQSKKVAEGGFANAEELDAAIHRGKIENYIAYGAVGVGGALFIGGAIKVLLNIGGGSSKVSVTTPVSSDRWGIAISGRF